MTIKIGITGGIGSGKSMVSQLFELLNIPIYISDNEAKKLTLTNPYIRKELIALLGESIYLGDGELNKKQLASYLFSDPKHIKQINAIIHPQVKADFRKWVLNQSSIKILGIESAILFEAGFRSEVDVSVMVYAPLEVRLARAMKRDKATKEEILKRIQAQMSDEEKVKGADYIIINDGERALIPQVLELISFLSKKYD